MNLKYVIPLWARTYDYDDEEEKEEEGEEEEEGERDKSQSTNQKPQPLMRIKKSQYKTPKQTHSCTKISMD